MTSILTVSNDFVSNIRTLLTIMIGGVSYALSPRCQVRKMSTDTYHLLTQTIQTRYPESPIHCRSDRTITHNSLPLENIATFFKYIVVNGKHFFASQTAGWNKSLLVHVLIPGPIPRDAYGEVLEILQINQDFWNKTCPLWIAQVRWFKPWSGEQDQIWHNL